MADSRFTGGKMLGTGIGLRVPHYDHILREKPAVDWFEIISENYMVEGGRALAVLDSIMDQYQVVMHGVGMYPGNGNGLDMDHLRRLKKLIKRTNGFLITSVGAVWMGASVTTFCHCHSLSMLPEKLLRIYASHKIFWKFP